MKILKYIYIYVTLSTKERAASLLMEFISDISGGRGSQHAYVCPYSYTGKIQIVSFSGIIGYLFFFSSFHLVGKPSASRQKGGRDVTRECRMESPYPQYK